MNVWIGRSPYGDRAIAVRRPCDFCPTIRASYGARTVSARAPGVCFKQKNRTAIVRSPHDSRKRRPGAVRGPYGVFLNSLTRRKIVRSPQSFKYFLNFYGHRTITKKFDCHRTISTATLSYWTDKVWSTDWPTVWWTKQPSFMCKAIYPNFFEGDIIICSLT